MKSRPPRISATRSPPILALNFLPSDRAGAGRLLSVRACRRKKRRAQVARRMLADGHRRGVALVPEGDWGTRVLAAFRQELEAGGGVLLADVALDSTRTDWAPEITQVLRISESARATSGSNPCSARSCSSSRAVARTSTSSSRPSPAATARLVRPQLRFHFAGDVATYATSDAFEPDPSANEDMEGLMFPDMPWMLGGDLADSVRSAAREAWPTGGPRRNRLFAFGFDAFRLAIAPARRGRQRQRERRWAHRPAHARCGPARAARARVGAAAQRTDAPAAIVAAATMTRPRQ